MRELMVLMRVNIFRDTLSSELKEKFVPIGKRIVENYNRPFYEWKIRSQQNIDIKDILKGASKTDHEVYKVLFCVYVAEWIKYNHDGGSIKWDDIINKIPALSRIGNKYKYGKDAVIKGFRFLHRECEIIPEEYLHTLARESGFPIKLLQTEKYRRGFKNLLSGNSFNGIPKMYDDVQTQRLWGEISQGLIDLEYNQNSEVLEGVNFRYYGIDENIRNWLKQTQQETQENKVKISFTLEKTENADGSMRFEVHKEIKAPRKINADSSKFVEIKVAKHSPSAWWDNSGWDETIRPIRIGNSRECLDPVYVHIDDRRISVTDSPFSAVAGADLRQDIVYFVSTKQANIFTFSKSGYCNKRHDQDMYALYPAGYDIKSETECTAYDIFDGYEIIQIQGDIQFFDGETQIGGVSDEYKDIEPENKYRGDEFYNPNIQIGTQGYPVYKGLPKVCIGNSEKDFTHYRYDKKFDIMSIGSQTAILGRVELFYMEDNKRKASLICIVLPTDFDIPIRDNMASLPPKDIDWKDENGSAIDTIDGKQKSASKINMHLSGKTIPVIIDWVKYENAFYKKSENGDDVKVDNGDSISLWDIEGAYVKVYDSEQKITINDNHATTKKIPYKQRFDLYSMIDTIRDELLLGYTDGKNQQPIKVAIVEEYKVSHIKIDPYRYRISVNSDEHDARIVLNNTKPESTISESHNLQFICFQSNKVVNVPCYYGYYDLKIIVGRGAGILYVQNGDHIKSAFYANADDTDVDDNDLKSIIITNKNNRMLNIAERYSVMIQNPDDYGADWKYLETLLTAVDEGIPIRDMDAFKAWYKCPDIVPKLYERYLDDTKMQNRIKKVIEKNRFPKLISYVAYKSLYKKIYDNLLNKKVSHIMIEYGLVERNHKIYELYKIENDSGLEKDCLNETETLILKMFNDDKILYRLLHNDTGKNCLEYKYILHKYIIREKENWVLKIKHVEIYGQELQKVIDCFSAEYEGQINRYTEKDFIQCNRLYNYTYDEPYLISTGNKDRYENKKIDFVDKMADILKMDELKKESTKNE